MINDIDAKLLEQIADLTGQRPSTVRAQLTRARQMLEELLKGENDA